MSVKPWIFVLELRRVITGSVKYQFAYEIKNVCDFYQKPFRSSGAAFLKVVECEK